MLPSSIIHNKPKAEATQVVYLSMEGWINKMQYIPQWKGIQPLKGKPFSHMIQHRQYAKWNKLVTKWQTLYDFPYIGYLELLNSQTEGKWPFRKSKRMIKWNEELLINRYSFKFARWKVFWRFTVAMSTQKCEYT